MPSTIRRPAIWVLILALLLLAICVILLLARMLEPPPPPVTDIASARTPNGLEGGAAGPEASPRPAETQAPQGAAGPEDPQKEVQHTSRETAPAPDVPAAPGRIVGTLVNTSGVAVAGATVLAAHAPDLGVKIEPGDWWIAHLPLDVADATALGAEAPRRAMSGPQGDFSFEDFEPGRVRLAVRSPHHDPVDRSDLWLAAGAVLSLEGIRLEPATVISGRIFDPDGQPILGATIVRVDDLLSSEAPALVPGSGVVLAQTDRRGAFTTSPIGQGPWSIHVSGGDELADLAIARGKSEDAWSLEATLVPSERIRGRVRSSARKPDSLLVRARPFSSTRSTVPFACRADARSVQVLGNGRFELTGLDPGSVYELRASEPSRTFEIDSSWSPPVLAIAGGGEVDVAWETDASVTFRAVEAGTREPLGACGASLEGFDPPYAVPEPASDGLSGLLAIDGLRPLRSATQFRLCLSKAGFLPAEQDLREIRPASDFALGEIELTAIPTMRVRVVDAESRQPIPCARVASVEIFPDVATTDAKGEARIHAYPGAGSEIEVRADGYAHARLGGPFGGGFNEARVEIALLRGATVTVRVLDAAGEGVAGARVERIEGNWSPNETWRDLQASRILDRPDPRTSRIADEHGTAVFAHVAPGRHAFRVCRYRTYLDGEWSMRELGEGETTEILLVSQAPAALQVRVRDEGTALAGAPVALLRHEDVADPIALLDARTPLAPGVDARLDASGAATFENLAPGGYFLAIGVAGQGVRAFREVNVAEGGNRLEIDLAHRAIVGRVSDPEGAPVAGAEIHLVSWDRRPRDRSPSGLEFFGARQDSEDLANGLEIAATIADEDGRYRILGLPKGESFVMMARAGAHWSGAYPRLHLGPDDVATQADLSLSPAGAIEVQIATRPAVMPCVLAAVPRERRMLPRILRTVSGSSVVLGGLEPGWWEIRVDAGGLGMRRENVEVVGGATSFLEFALP